MKRSEEITILYIDAIDRHLDDLINTMADEMFEIENFAAILFIDVKHLSNTIKKATGFSACGIYQVKIMERALRLLSDQSLSIREIALILTFEPSQFTKWFKRFAEITPKEYRNRLLNANQTNVNSEMMTILKKYANVTLYF